MRFARSTLLVCSLALGGCAEVGALTAGMVIGPAVGLAFRLAGSGIESVVPDAGQLCIQEDGLLGIIVKESVFKGRCAPVRVLTAPASSQEPLK
jgi:hypothetical protein